MFLSSPSFLYSYIEIFPNHTRTLCGTLPSSCCSTRWSHPFLQLILHYREEIISVTTYGNGCYVLVGFSITFTYTLWKSALNSVSDCIFYIGSWTIWDTNLPPYADPSTSTRRICDSLLGRLTPLWTIVRHTSLPHIHLPPQLETENLLAPSMQ